MEIADAHVHYFSPEFFRFQAEQKGVKEVGSLVGWDVPETSEDLADRWVVEMNHQGVASAVLVASAPGDVESVATAVERHPAAFPIRRDAEPAAAGRGYAVLAGARRGLCERHLPVSRDA